MNISNIDRDALLKTFWLMIEEMTVFIKSQVNCKIILYEYCFLKS